MRESLAMVSRIPKPQSIRPRVPPASTSRPLPSLPLPSDANRMLPIRRRSKRASARSLELILEQGENLVAVGGPIGSSSRVLNVNYPLRVRLLHPSSILSPILFLTHLTAL